MNLITFQVDTNQNFDSQRNIFSVFKQEEEQKGIQQGMSPKEIAEIVSERLIEVIRQQFEEAKREFRALSDKPNE